MEQIRDHLYQKSKKSKDPKDRRTFLNSKHGVKQNINLAYNKYLEDILGLNDRVSQDPETCMSGFSRKKLFSFLKISRTDSQGFPILKNGESTFTQSDYQADVLNSQFQSFFFFFFSIRSPLDLSKLYHSTLLNGSASLINLLPDNIKCRFQLMPDLDISVKSNFYQGGWA